MALAEIKNFAHPDETRPFQGHGKVDVLALGDRPATRAVFEPGWRWTTDVKPIAGTDLCETSHFGYCVSGRMRVTMADGDQYEMGPGDVFRIEPGHDAEVLGDEACIAVDFGDVGTYAKRS